MNATASSGYASNGATSIYYESFGSSADPTLLLVGGLGMQAISYTVELVNGFVERGLHVVRYDNRDTGLSTDFAGAPAIGRRGNAYEITDMAADGIAVLDQLSVDRAHVFGVSMGGMIVQTMAIEHPQRLATMTSVMSSTGEKEYGQPSPEAFAVLTGPPPTGRQQAIDNAITGMRTWGSPAFADPQRVAEQAAAAYDRAFRPDGVLRQYLAIMAAGSGRADRLATVTTPTLVIHGTADTLIAPSGGQRTAALIPGARLELVEGMGHDLPPELRPQITELVMDFIAAHR